MAYKILVVDDDLAILRLIKKVLEYEKYEVVIRNNIEEIDLCDFTGFDLILLDIMMPVSGLEICQMIREQITVPICFITAKDMDEDLVAGINAGADDYIMKPFNPNELVARVRAHIQRYERIMEHSGQSSPIIRSGILEIQPDAYRVLVRGEEVNLTHREFEVLAFLAQNPNIVFSREALFEKIWGYDALGETATVMVHINRIREKIEPDPAHPVYLETVRGAGYRFRK